MEPFYSSTVLQKHMPGTDSLRPRNVSLERGWSPNGISGILVTFFSLRAAPTCLNGDPYESPPPRNKVGVEDIAR